MKNVVKFTEKDFDSFLSKDIKQQREVKEKVKKLVNIISRKLDGYSGIYEYRKGRWAGYFSELRSRKNNPFFNFQLNADDLSLEFQIENKNLLLKFLKNVDIKILNNLKKLGDCEIAVWDKDKKVCKFYPAFLDESNIKFLINKLKSIKYPIFKFRKIYPRDEARKLLNSPRLINDLIGSMKLMKILEIPLMNVRPAKLQDLKQIQKIEKEYYEGFSCPKETLKSWLKLSENFIVAEKNGKIVAFIFFEYLDKIEALPFIHKTQHKKKGKFVYISEIGILDEYKNTNILQILLNKVVRKTKQRRSKKIIWLTGQKNKHDKIERNLILKNNFVKVKCLNEWEACPGYFVSDHLIFEKVLK